MIGDNSDLPLGGGERNLQPVVQKGNKQRKWSVSIQKMNDDEIFSQDKFGIQGKSKDVMDTKQFNKRIEVESHNKMIINEKDVEK